MRQLDDHAAAVLATGMAPALGVAVCDPERTTLLRTYGDAEPDALWAIGSIGKSVTAVLALQLAAEGALDLHAPVTAYVDWLALPGPGGPVTLHHLLTHTAGVIASSDQAPASTWDVVALCGQERGFAPGAHHHYSNVGYRAIGVVLEAVTGEGYGDLVQQRVLDPLGMRDSVPVMRHATRRRMPGGHLPLHDDRPWERAHGLVPAPYVESAEADGCLACTLEDLAVYLRALWTGDRLLPAEQLALMRTDHAAGYGYGVEVAADGFGHGGDMLGYVAHLWADTVAGVGVVACANGFGGAWDLGEGALALAKGEAPADPALDQPPAALTDDGSCPAEWAAYPGRYRSPNPWLPAFAVAARDGGLVLGIDWTDLSERLPLAPLGDGAFRVGDAPWSPERLVFDTVLDGRAQRAVSSGTPYYRAFTS